MNLSNNRINPNAPRNGRAPAGRTPAQSQPARPQVEQANTLSNYGTTTRIRSLYPGQIVKGEVTDLRNTEVVVTLENNTTVAGKLTNGSWLAIGETAAFKVASATQANIILEALPRTDMALANSTIQKALEEAGLPKTNRNQQIVLELMNNQLPIHKQAIQQMMQQSFQYKEIQIPTLVLLHKLQIPITLENAKQFEMYQNNEHSISDQLQELSSSLTTLLKHMADPSANTVSHSTENINLVPEQGAPSPREELIQQLTNQNSISAANNQNFQATTSHILSAILDASANAETFSKTVLPDTTLQLSDQNKEELLSILENYEFPEALKESILSDSASLRDVIHLIHKDFEQAFALDMSISEEQMQIEGEQTPNTKEPENLMLRTSLFDSSVIQEIEQQFTSLQQANKELGGMLDNIQRIHFSEIINAFPVDESIKEKVASGEINRTELIRTLKNVLPFTEMEPATQLLHSDAFEQLVKDEFMDALLLTPKDIFKQGGVNHYYQKLSKQLEELDNLLDKQLLSRQNQESATIMHTLQNHTKETVEQVKSNLDFMKVLNQFFSYVQLPVKLHEKCTHADLYVYTKKKALSKQNTPIHVLLRLDMEHLGAMDVDVILKDQNVTANFALSNDKAINLIKTNINLLEDALLEKGYLCNSTIGKLEKEVDLVKDFIAQDSTPQEITRYSFDLRA